MDNMKAKATMELGKEFGDEGMGIDYQTRQVRDELNRLKIKPLYANKRLILWDEDVVRPLLVEWRAKRDAKQAKTFVKKPDPPLPDIDFEVEFQKLEKQNACLLRAIEGIKDQLASFERFAAGIDKLTQALGV